MLYGPHPLPDLRGKVVACNHASFWDGIVLYHLLRGRLGGGELACLIDARQVAEHPFFRRVGGIALDRGRPRAAIAAARRVLARGGCVVIFPQGRIVHPDRRPLGFERGVGLLGRSAAVVPLSVRYSFWEEQRPEAMVWVGEVLPAGSDAAAVEAAVTAGADALAAADRAWEVGRVVLRGRRGVSRWKELLPWRGRKVWHE